MKLLIDLQGAQTGSRHRGIGRYSEAFAKGIITNRGDHEVYVLLNGAFPEEAKQIINDLKPFLPKENFIVFESLKAVEGYIVEDSWRNSASEMIREWFINLLDPDVVLISSLFEGAIDDGCLSIGRLRSGVRVATVLYDLIPLADPATHLPDEVRKSWYFDRLENLKRADLMLAISQSARIETIEHLRIPVEKSATIYSAASDLFRRVKPVARKTVDELLTRVGINRGFILNASAYEPRKNFEGMIRAFALLPAKIRAGYQIVLVSAISLEGQIRLRTLADDCGLGPDELVFAGRLDDADLLTLYSSCDLFVFPSFVEGFGLPPLEAMSCGAVTIGSNTTSVPEVIGCEEALFDPYSDQSMADCMKRGLTDLDFRARMKKQAAIQATKFSWDRTAIIALRELEVLAAKPRVDQANTSVKSLVAEISALKAWAPPSPLDLVAVSNAIERNHRAAIKHRAARGLPELPSDEEAGPAPLPSPTLQVLVPDPVLTRGNPRILLLKLDHIGDFIISLEAFSTIRARWPNAVIDLVCGPWNVEFAQMTGLFDTVFSCKFIPPTGGQYDKDLLSRGLREFIALNLGDYDLAVDMRYYDDSRLLLLGVNARYRGGYASPGIKLDVEIPAGAGVAGHISVKANALASAVTSAFTADLPVTRDLLLAGRAPHRGPAGRRSIGLAVGTGNAIKAWGTDRFARLAKRLVRDGETTIVLIGAPADKAAADYVAKRLPADAVENLTGTMSITDTFPRIAGLDGFVGNDTGTTHAAAALGVPTICLFSGQSDVDNWKPIGPVVKTLKLEVACSPCYLTRLEHCRFGHVCMNIDPAVVASELLSVVKNADYQRESGVST